MQDKKSKAPNNGSDKKFKPLKIMLVRKFKTLKTLDRGLLEKSRKVLEKLGKHWNKPKSM